MEKTKMFERGIMSPIGLLRLTADNEGITRLDFGYSEVRSDETELLLRAEQELNEYFAGRRKVFSVPLSLKGTSFQLKVWKALTEIPYGETRTYAQIAEKIGCPKGFRAVGMANHVNPIAIIVPCHRVIGSGGKLVGYAGGMDIKQKLLTLEGYNV